MGSKIKAQGRILVSLRNVQNDLPKAMQKLANFILENPAKVVSSNVSEIASLAQVGEATVIRLAKTLGFNGFQDFKIDLAIDVSNIQKADENIVDSHIKDGDTPSLISKKLESSIVSALSENIDFLEEEKVKQVANSIYISRRVFILGMGNSGLCAQYLKNKLSRIGINAICESNTHFMYTTAALLEPGDVTIAITQKGQSEETFKACKISKEAGALIVVITHQTSSRIAKLADYVFYSGHFEGNLQSDSVGTIVAQLHLCEILYIMLVQLNPLKAKKTKQLTLDALYKS